MNDRVQEEFEDNHEDSEIFDYFRNIKADIPIHLFYLIIEIIIEIIIVYKIKKRFRYKIIRTHLLSRW